MPAITTSYTYEDNRDVKTAVINGSVATYGYTYDTLGRRTARTQSGTAFPQTTTDQFGYNDRSEVTASNRYEGTNPVNPVENYSFGYAYDHIGNRIQSSTGFQPVSSTTTYVASNLNQYSSVQSASSAEEPFYDLDGNLTQDDTWHYHWNGDVARMSGDGLPIGSPKGEAGKPNQNRLVALTPVAPIEGSKKLTFWYDYQGRRFQKRTETLQSGQWTLTDERKFLYDDWNLIAEYKLHNSSFNLHTSYTWGLDLSLTPQGAGGVGGLLKSTNYSLLTTSYYLYDANGNVTQMVDSQSNITASYEYSPFGEVLTTTGSTAEDNAFRFSTKYEDAETGLLYYGYRYYNPEMGRWLNRDPIGERGGLNLYGNFKNKLINRVDYLGMQMLPSYFVTECWAKVSITVAPIDKECPKNCSNGEGYAFDFIFDYKRSESDRAGLVAKLEAEAFSEALESVDTENCEITGDDNESGCRDYMTGEDDYGPPLSPPPDFVA